MQVEPRLAGRAKFAASLTGSVSEALALHSQQPLRVAARGNGLTEERVPQTSWRVVLSDVRFDGAIGKVTYDGVAGILPDRLEIARPGADGSARCIRPLRRSHRVAAVIAAAADTG